MDKHALTQFFLWCTIMNGGLLLTWSTALLVAPDFLYRMNIKWAPISRETFNVAVYAFLGLFKILVLFFNVVPLLALLIIG